MNKRAKLRTRAEGQVQQQRAKTMKQIFWNRVEQNREAFEVKYLEETCYFSFKFVEYVIMELG